MLTVKSESMPEVWVHLYDVSQLQYLPLLQGKASTVVWYGNLDSVLVSQIKDAGFKIVYAVDALRVCESDVAFNGYENIQLRREWCQRDLTSKELSFTQNSGYAWHKISGSHRWESWFSPLGPFTFRVTLPRVNKAIAMGFDGIFLMSFDLWQDDNVITGGASDDQYSQLVKKELYNSMNWQDFRTKQIAVMSSWIAGATQSSDLKVYYSDDNIYMRSWPDVLKLKDRFAVNTTGIQPFNGGYVFEWLGTPEDNAVAEGTTWQQQIDAAVNCIRNARVNDRLTKSITLICMTGRQDVYNYLMQKAAENNFNIWTSWRFLAGLPTSPYA